MSFLMKLTLLCDSRHSVEYSFVKESTYQETKDGSMKSSQPIPTLQVLLPRRSELLLPSQNAPTGHAKRTWFTPHTGF
jgi:hypothetical protein